MPLPTDWTAKWCYPHKHLAQPWNTFALFRRAILQCGPPHAVSRREGARADRTGMATQTFFDFNAMIVELERLEQQERKVSAIRRQLHDRLDAFPNEATAVKERKISDARRALHKRIDALKAELDIWGK